MKTDFFDFKLLKRRTLQLIVPKGGDTYFELKSTTYWNPFANKSILNVFPYCVAKKGEMKFNPPGLNPTIQLAPLLGPQSQ